jgi:hypothetical protein
MHGQKNTTPDSKNDSPVNSKMKIAPKREVENSGFAKLDDLEKAFLFIHINSNRFQFNPQAQQISSFFISYFVYEQNLQKIIDAIATSESSSSKNSLDFSPDAKRQAYSKIILHLPSSEQLESSYTDYIQSRKTLAAMASGEKTLPDNTEAPSSRPGHKRNPTSLAQDIYVANKDEPIKVSLIRKLNDELWKKTEKTAEYLPNPNLKHHLSSEYSKGARVAIAISCMILVGLIFILPFIIKKGFDLNKEITIAQNLLSPQLRASLGNSPRR